MILSLTISGFHFLVENTRNFLVPYQPSSLGIDLNEFKFSGEIRYQWLLSGLLIAWHLGIYVETIDDLMNYLKER